MRLVPAAIFVMSLAVQSAAAANYRADLGPMPLDDETKAVIAGRGDAIATIEGDRLTVAGRFHSLPSPATAAHIALSPAIGVPGKTMLMLKVTGAHDGTVSGSYRLTKAQTQALASGRLYVQIDSEKAPPGYSWGPKGTLWGWLMPEHPQADPGVPQQDHWFIPQLDIGPGAAPRPTARQSSGPAR